MKTLWQKITKTNSCWEWNAYTTQAGYGQVMYKGKLTYAHRLLYELSTGKKIPTGLCIDHLCRNRKCVNPAHLEVVTLKENTLRGVGMGAINSRKTHCLRGHNLIDSYIDKYNKRHCRKCNQIRKKAFKQRQRLLV